MWFDHLQTIRNNFQKGFKYWFVSIRMEKKKSFLLHKKGDKQVLKNSRPVSLLPVCGKIFERLIFNEMFSFLTRKWPYFTKSIWVQSWDSWTNQLLSIKHEVCQSFDKGVLVFRHFNEKWVSISTHQNRPKKLVKLKRVPNSFLVFNNANINLK